MKTLLALSVCGGLLAGCTTRSLEYQGVKYQSRSFGTRASVGELDATFTTNSASVKVKGYSNDQVEALGIVTKAAVEGALKAAKTP